MNTHICMHISTLYFIWTNFRYFYPNYNHFNTTIAICKKHLQPNTSIWQKLYNSCCLKSIHICIHKSNTKQNNKNYSYISLVVINICMMWDLILYGNNSLTRYKTYLQKNEDFQQSKNLLFSMYTDLIPFSYIYFLNLPHMTLNFSTSDTVVRTNPGSWLIHLKYCTHCHLEMLIHSKSKGDFPLTTLFGQTI